MAGGAALGLVEDPPVAGPWDEAAAEPASDADSVPEGAADEAAESLPEGVTDETLESLPEAEAVEAADEASELLPEGAADEVPSEGLKDEAGTSVVTVVTMPSAPVTVCVTATLVAGSTIVGTPDEAWAPEDVSDETSEPLPEGAADEAGT